MSRLLLVGCLLLLHRAAGARVWGASIRGGASSGYPQSLLDDVDDFDYVREREEIAAREAGISSPAPQPAEMNACVEVEGTEVDPGFAEDDRTDDEEIFFQGPIREDKN